MKGVNDWAAITEPENCGYVHTFIWSSHTSIDKVPPKGTLCKCGQYRTDGKGGVQPNQEEVKG